MSWVQLKVEGCTSGTYSDNSWVAPQDCGAQSLVNRPGPRFILGPQLSPWLDLSQLMEQTGPHDKVFCFIRIHRHCSGKGYREEAAFSRGSMLPSALLPAGRMLPGLSVAGLAPAAGISGVEGARPGHGRQEDGPADGGGAEWERMGSLFCPWDPAIADRSRKVPEVFEPDELTAPWPRAPLE